MTFFDRRTKFCQNFNLLPDQPIQHNLKFNRNPSAYTLHELLHTCSIESHLLSGTLGGMTGF